MLDWFEHDAVQEEYFLLGKSLEGLPVGVQHLFAALGRSVHPQAAIECL